MTHTKRVPRFGPLFYTVLSVALLLIVAFFGCQIWGTVEQRITTQRYLRDLRDSDAKVRQIAVEQLSAIGADYSPTLVQLLTHQNGAIRVFACEQLGTLRPLDESAFSPLTNSLSDTDPMVRCNAAYAIARYATIAPRSSDKEAAVRRLCKTLHDENTDVREAAAYALGEFGARSPMIVPTLKAALNDNEPNVRLRAAWSLYEIDHDHLSLMISIIEDVMSGDDASAHNFVFSIVVALGPVAEDEMPEVVKEINRRFGHDDRSANIQSSIGIRESQASTRRQNAH